MNMNLNAVCSPRLLRRSFFLQRDCCKSTQRSLLISRSSPAKGVLNPSAAADKPFTDDAAPEMALGPVSTLRTTGRGHGLATTRIMNAGELVFTCPALAVVTEEDLENAKEDQDLMDLKFNALQRKLLSKRYTVAELGWLQALSPAPYLEEDEEEEEEASPSGTAASGPLPEIETLISRHLVTESQQDQQLPSSFSDRLEGILQANAFEAQSEDADLAYAAGKEPRQEVMGLWPHYALLNHSCAPNTVTYAHLGMLVTRASRNNIGKGAELTTNYIGDLLLSPLDVRREALEDSYGFVCSCARCKDEEKLVPDMVKLMADIHEACTDQVREELEDAIEEDDTAALEGLRDQLAAFAEVLDAAFTKKKIAERTQIWIQVALFELYELLFTCVEALGQVDKSLLELLQALTAETQPGSDLHCYYSRLLLEADESEEASSSSTSKDGGVAGAGEGFGPGMASGSKYALGLCYKAYSTRYGPLSKRVFGSIIKKRREIESDADDE